MDISQFNATARVAISVKKTDTTMRVTPSAGQKLCHF